VVERFSELINPERSVPRRITDLTGISTAMVFDRPTASEILPEYLRFLGDGVLVAHNLPFDLGFLNATLTRIGFPALENATLCTLRLARRLLRGLRSKSLGSVADFYGIKAKSRHRALGDAEVTAEILLRFLSQLSFDPGLATMGELLSFQHRRYAQISRDSRHLQRIREEVLPDVPERPGVYFMKDAKGETIYIGKAAVLRNRVRQYFAAVEAHASHIRQMVGLVRTVEWQETGSELAALLLESRLIKEEQPRFNRADRRYGRRPFIRLAIDEPYPRVSARVYLADDGAEYFGPMPSRRHATLAMELINRHFGLRECDDATFERGNRCLYAEMGRCTAPCEGGSGAEAYTAEVARLRAFLTGQDRSVLERLESDMAAASASLDFEKAAVYRDELEALTQMLDKQWFIASSVLDHHTVLIMSGLEPGTTQLFFVRFGRHVDTLTIDHPLDNAVASRLRASVAVHFDPDLPRPERYLKQEVDEIRVLAHWLYVHRKSARQVAWDPSMDLDSYCDKILARVENPQALPI